MPADKIIIEEKAQLVKGPQDGGNVVVPDDLGMIYVGRTWQGDGFVSWGRECSKRFPVRYMRVTSGGNFVHVPDKANKK